MRDKQLAQLHRALWAPVFLMVLGSKPTMRQKNMRAFTITKTSLLKPIPGITARADEPKSQRASSKNQGCLLPDQLGYKARPWDISSSLIRRSS